MIPDVDFVKEKFDTFNTLCFDGELTPVPVRLTRVRSYLGQLKYKRQRTQTGQWEYFGFVLCINTLMDLPQKVVEDTIIHEMIHYWILSNHFPDTATHGMLFRFKMNYINHFHRRHITIRHVMQEKEADQDQRRRVHFICISEMQDGEVGITVSAHTRVPYLWNEMSKFIGLKSQRWVVTSDPFFNRYPRSLTPKIYRIDADLLQEHLKEALLLNKENGRFFTSNL